MNMKKQIFSNFPMGNKTILYIICALIMISSVFAVSRSTVTGTITYTKSVTMPNSGAGLLKGYWAIEDTVSGCTFNTASCGTSSYYNCSKSGSTIRVVGHSDDSGVNLPSSVVVTVGGTGTCTLSMNHVESWKTSTATNLGSSTGPVAGSVTLGTTCNNPADTNTNCIISNQELLNYITLWISGSVTNPQLLGVITIWINGGY